MIARTFRDLRVYQAARQSAHTIFEFTRRLPADERYALSDQVRRSSRAIKAMIAEAWGRRRYKAVFVSKLDEALGEMNETQAWLDDAVDGAYLQTAEFDNLDSAYVSIGRILSRMIDRADDFCKNAPSTDYRSLEPRVEETSEASDGLDEFFTTA